MKTLLCQACLQLLGEAGGGDPGIMLALVDQKLVPLLARLEVDNGPAVPVQVLFVVKTARPLLVHALPVAN